MLRYHQQLYHGGKHKDVPVGVAGWPAGQPGSDVPARCSANPPASWILLAQKNLKRGWWQAACRDWLVTCAHRYLLSPVRCAGRGFKSSSVRQECRMHPMGQAMGVTQPGWRGVGVWSRTSASPSPQIPYSTISHKTSDHFLCWENGMLLWGSPTDCGTFLKMLISGHKLNSPCEAQCSCLSRTYLQLQLTHLANERSMGCGHPSWLLLFRALKHEM